MEQNIRVVLYRERDNATLVAPGPDAVMNTTRDADGSNGYVYTPDAATKALVTAFYTGGLANDTVDILFYDDAAESPLDIVLALASKRCPHNVANGWIQTAAGRGDTGGGSTAYVTSNQDVVFRQAAAKPANIAAGGNDSEDHLPAGSSRVRPTAIVGQTIYAATRTRTYLTSEGVTSFVSATNWSAWEIATAAVGFSLDIAVPASLQSGASGDINVTVNADANAATELSITVDQGTLAASTATIAAGNTTASISYTAPNRSRDSTTTVAVQATRYGVSTLHLASITILPAAVATLTADLQGNTDDGFNIVAGGNARGRSVYNWILAGRAASALSVGSNRATATYRTPSNALELQSWIGAVITRDDRAALASYEGIFPGSGVGVDPASLDFSLTTPDQTLQPGSKGSFSVSALTGTDAATAIWTGYGGPDLDTAMTAANYQGNHTFDVDWDNLISEATVGFSKPDGTVRPQKGIGFVSEVSASGITGEMAFSSHSDNGSILTCILQNVPADIGYLRVYAAGLSFNSSGSRGNEINPSLSGTNAVAVSGNMLIVNQTGVRIDDEEFAIGVYVSTGTSIKRIGSMTVEKVGNDKNACEMYIPRFSSNLRSVSSGQQTSISARCRHSSVFTWGVVGGGAITASNVANTTSTATFTAPNVTTASIVRVRATASRVGTNEVTWAETLFLVSP